MSEPVSVSLEVEECSKVDLERIMGEPKMRMYPCPLGAPTTCLANNGTMIHPLSSEADPALSDLEVIVYSLKAGYGSNGAKAGSASREAELFREEMIRFWSKALDPRKE